MMSIFGKSGVCLSLMMMSGVLGCDDSTVGLDPTVPVVRKALVVGACPASNSGDVSEVRLSVLLESDDGQSAGPSFRLLEERKDLGEILSPENFSFELNTDSVGAYSGEDQILYGATATQESDFDQNTIQFIANEVSYVAPGYPSGADENIKRAIDAQGKLVIFAMDNSGSLIGSDDRRDAAVDNYNDLAASDRGDNRKVFFDQMLDLLRPDDYVSLVKISTNGANIENCVDSAEACTSGDLQLCSNPTRDRSRVRCGLQALSTEKSGTTPLNRVLTDIYQRIILAQANADLNPVVVLFTDGAEYDSDIRELLRPEGAIELYKNGHLDPQNPLRAPVPVFVLHLDQKLEANTSFGFSTGRDPRLMSLACETGGDYIFLETAEEMTSARWGSLSRIITNRIMGAWSVQLETDLSELERTSWYISTTMRVVVANRQLSFAMQQGDPSDPSADSRLWFSLE